MKALPDTVLVVIRGYHSTAKVFVNLKEGTDDLVRDLKWAGGEVVSATGETPVEVLLPRDRVQFGVDASGV